MFSLRTFFICAVYAAILYFGRKIEIKLAARQNNRPGLILPVVAWVVAGVMSVKNFLIAFDVTFSLIAFLASLALFVFYAVPAMYFSILYTNGRKEVRERQMVRSKRVRQARTQQRVQTNLQSRYDSPMVKQEPVVYSPEGREPRSRVSSPKKAAPRKINSSGRTSRTTKR